MKSKILSILFVVTICLALPVWAITTYNVDSLTGGAARSLDYLSVSDLSNGDRAIVAYRSGSSDYLIYMKYYSSGVTAEQTTTHPYYVRPDDYATGGVWCEMAPDWMHLAGTLESLTVTDLTATNAEITTLTSTNLRASFSISGASLIAGHTSGASLVSLGTYVYHSGVGSSVYGLPPIPTTGVSLPFVVFDCGPAGGGITVYPYAPSQPFLGSGLSGTSYLALPPGNPFETATLFGVVDESGLSAFWKVKADANWVAGS